MFAPLRSVLPLLLACLAGCPVWEPLADCADFDACDTTGAGSTSEGVTPTNATGGIQTETGDDWNTTSSVTESGLETGDTTGQAAGPPFILDVLVTPNPIDINGLVSVTVTADHAAGVRMETGLGASIELTPQPQPGVFIGAFPVVTGLQNGARSALLTPWKGMVDGETREASYKVALPKPGSQGLWETGDLIGAGRVAAVGTLPGGELVEFGHHAPAGEPHCYLRRRDKGGLWDPADVIDVLPDTACEALDLKIDEHGALFVLFNYQSDNTSLWRLMKIPAWGQPAQHVALGVNDEKAVALALHDSGAIAVCGTTPTGQVDEVDAMAQIFRPNLPGQSWTVDYRLADKAHLFAERTRDCVFDGDLLTLVGAVYGAHGLELAKRDRLFILRLDAATQTAAWFVAPPSDKLQSGAETADVDGHGLLAIGAHTCDDDCKPFADLRLYDPQNTLVWQVPLGSFSVELFAAQDIAWSPAGYIVVATGGLTGDETAFTVRAFAPSQVEALWTFTRKDLNVLHFVLALTIGEYGEVYAGGFGANSYPAVAFIAG